MHQQHGSSNVWKSPDTVISLYRKKVRIIQEKDSLSLHWRIYRKHLGLSLCLFPIIQGLWTSNCPVVCQEPSLYSGTTPVWKHKGASAHRRWQHQEPKLVGRDVFGMRLQTLLLFQCISTSNPHRTDLLWKMGERMYQNCSVT